MVVANLDREVVETVFEVFFPIVNQLYAQKLVSDLYFYVVVVDPTARLGDGAFSDSILAMSGFGDEIAEAFRRRAIDRAKTALYSRDVQNVNMHVLLPSPPRIGVSYMYGIPVGVGGVNDNQCQMLAEMLGAMLHAVAVEKQDAETSADD